MVTGWTPDSGDIVWVDFDPQSGREQAGHRPAVVLSPALYNAKAGLMICVPLTTRIKGYPFEVPIPGKRGGVALVDQVRSIDWRARKVTRKGQASDTALEAIRSKLRTLIG